MFLHNFIIIIAQILDKFLGTTCSKSNTGGAALTQLLFSAIINR